MIGARVVATVFVLGTSIAGPQALGVATAESGPDSASTQKSASSSSRPNPGSSTGRRNSQPIERGHGPRAHRDPGRADRPAPAAAAPTTPTTVHARADHDAAGGAIEISFAEGDYVNFLTTTGVRFVSNAASSRRVVATGGAIAFDGSAFVDNGSTFDGNQARSGRSEGSVYGGALFLAQTSQLNATTVTRNSARADQGFGGGIALPLGPEVLTTSLTDVRRNRASTAGDQLWWPRGVTIRPFGPTVSA